MKKIPSILFGFLTLSVLAGCDAMPSLEGAKNWMGDKVINPIKNLIGGETENQETVHTHNFVEHSEVAPTCLEDGKEKYFTCEECGKVFDKDKKETTLEQIPAIDALGHDRILTSWQNDGDYHWHKCSRCDAVLDKAEHEWEAQSDSATCTTAGQVTYKCEVCEATKTEPSEMKGHSWDSGEVTKAATCTETGIMTYHCTVSGCDGVKTVDIPKVDHVFDMTKTPVDHLDPTCTEDGFNKFKCDNCDEITTVTITKLGHQAKEEWKFDDTKHWHECENTGCEEHVGEADHVATTTWETDASYHWKKCTSECGALLFKEAHSVTTWLETKAPTKTSEGEEQGTCSVCEKELTRVIPKLVPSPEDIISKINALGTEPKVMLLDAIKETYSDIALMESEDQAKVTNIDQLATLKAATDTLAVDIIGPYSKEVEAKNYSQTKVSVVNDETFGKVFSIDEKEDASWNTIQVSASEINDEEFADVGLLAFYINCDPVTANTIKLTLCEDFSQGGNGASKDVNPACSFFDRVTKDHHDILELGMYNDLFGNPGNDWHLVVLNAARTQKVLEFIKENKYFAFSIQANNIIKTGGNVKFTSLFGFKNFKFEENTFAYRHFNNSYSSQLPSWAAGDTINAKNNKALNIGFNFYTTDYKTEGATYSYKSGHEETVNDYFTYETASAYDGNFELLSTYFYVYTNMDTKCQVHFGGSSGPYYNLAFTKGINKIDIPADKALLLDDTNKTITFNFKDPSGNPTWAPGMIFENVGSIYGVFDVVTPEKIANDIEAIPENPKAMDMAQILKIKADFEKMSPENQALVENIDELEAVLESTTNYVPLITPYADGKFEKYNGDVTLGRNASDPVFGEVFTVSDASAEFGQWRTFRLSSTALDSAVLDQIGMLGIYVKTTGENHNYISLDAIIWNSKGGPTKINTAQIDGARFANKNNSYDGKSIINYPIYQETFGNPGNGWELCTISAQYTKTIINELKENGEISFASSSKLCDANGSFYVAGLFGIKANGTMPTEDLKAAYCFANGWQTIDNSATGMTKDSSHGRVDPTFNRCAWPTGPEGDPAKNNEVRLDHMYYTFKNTNASDVDPLSGAIVYDKGATVDASKSWSALYVYIYVKYETKVQISICGEYNNNYVTLNAGLNLVKLNNADIAVLKAKEGTADEGGGNFKMGLAFREGAKIPSGQIIYITGIFGLPAAE